MILKCGIIGLPNVGKSALFNLLTDSSVKSENYPFCTIQANKGLMPILDMRLFQLSRIIHVNHIIHENIELMDIAGIISGASSGEGLGNKFLNDISKVDILFHVVRCFNEKNIFHINKEIDPAKDITIVHDELILSDIYFCERLIFSLEKKKKNEQTQYIEKELTFLKKILLFLYERIMLYNLLFTMEEKKIIKNYNFLTLKPIIYIANVDINTKSNKYLSKLSDISSNTNIPYITLCILLEEKIKKYRIHNMTVDLDYLNIIVKNFKFFEIVNTIYQILRLKTFFTINTKSIRAWVIFKDTIAIEASNMIHTDFKKSFIRVQVVKYCDFIIFQGWRESKKFGKMRIEGKSYLIQDGDIVNFLI